MGNRNSGLSGADMYGKLIRSIFVALGSGLVSGLLITPLWSQEKAQGPPPANVSVATVKTRMIAPQTEFIATVFYEEVSEVASELEGLVEKVRFEEGQRVKQGQILVELGSDILSKRLEAAISSYEQILSDLDIAKIDLDRKEKLFRRKSIAEQAYDEVSFRVKSLEKRAASQKAVVERIEIELQKKSIRAPFAGIVIDRRVDRGEWLSAGEMVAVIAKDDVVDIVASVSEEFIPYLHVGMPVKGTANGNPIKGSLSAIIPRGDVATRTFPVKIRMVNSAELIEGMSATVWLPTGKSIKTLTVPRDALVDVFGQTVVYVAEDSKARMISVKVNAYEELVAGVESQGLSEGMQVVVEGNERLRDGQMVSLKAQKDHMDQ
jgi:RND family efflux transporter MFP subunit